ncbi:MAG: hypothetical protein KGY80_07635 [Candidatus Thorarchaeota archaeon]|nr:hypothetical protein [Candidatus Thorarchaeota archaeon]
MDSWRKTAASGEKSVRIPSSKLFGDLLIYLVEVFDRKGETPKDRQIRPFRYVEAFCDYNDLNRAQVCKLLKEHGADNDLEVLLNCLDVIPPYRSLPKCGEAFHNHADNAAIAAPGG